MHVSGQINQELIHFKSANPFSLSDIINDLENQGKTKCFWEINNSCR